MTVLKKTCKKKGYVGVILDFQKAYDQMEWNFLISVLKALDSAINS